MAEPSASADLARDIPGPRQPFSLDHYHPPGRAPSSAVPIPVVFRSAGAARESSQRGAASPAGRCRQLVIYLKLHFCGECLSCRRDPAARDGFGRQGGIRLLGWDPAARRNAGRQPPFQGLLSLPRAGRCPFALGRDTASFAATSPLVWHQPSNGIGGRVSQRPCCNPEPASGVWPRHRSGSVPQW